MQYWFLGVIRRDFFRFFEPKQKRPVHIMFAFVDHFEPGNGNASIDEQKTRVSTWVERYPVVAGKHVDSDGICPQHTFFFPPHYDTSDHLEKLVELCRLGFGEIEMHLHHDRQKPWPDDEHTLRKKILDCIEAYGRYKIFCLPNGQKAYGFIHGDWALANSLNDGEHCGVNDEISILQETGCYADFTFPVSNEAQPKHANRIFYGQSSSLFPKGYNRLYSFAKVGKMRQKGLLFIQGIIGIRWKSRARRFCPSIEQSNISASDLPFPERIDFWIKKGVHVAGKPEWIFVKIHGHGASSNKKDRDVLMDENVDRMFGYLEKEYNDMKNFFLHYVSAREMYNIIRAAEAGKKGNPNDFRDFEIPRYLYLPNRDVGS